MHILNVRTNRTIVRSENNRVRPFALFDTPGRHSIFCEFSESTRPEPFRDDKFVAGFQRPIRCYRSTDNRGKAAVTIIEHWQPSRYTMKRSKGLLKFTAVNKYPEKSHKRRALRPRHVASKNLRKKSII